MLLAVLTAGLSREAAEAPGRRDEEMLSAGSVWLRIAFAPGGGGVPAEG